MTARLPDELFRKVAGGDKTRSALTASGRVRLNALEREAETKRKHERQRLGPSVRRRVHFLNTDTPMDQLTNALLNNTCRSLVLDATVCDHSFNDVRAAFFASAIRNNRSVLSIILRGLTITEVGLCAIFESIKRSATIRAVQIDGIGLTPKALRSLRSMARSNAGLIHVQISNTGSEDEDEVRDTERAVQMNRLLVADPAVNPFENLLFAATQAHGAATDDDGFAWDAQSDESELEHFLEGEAAAFELHAGKLARPICGHYMQARCMYGSRCRHVHPERKVEVDVPLKALTAVPVPESSFTRPNVAQVLADCGSSKHRVLMWLRQACT